MERMPSLLPPPPSPWSSAGRGRNHPFPHPEPTSPLAVPPPSMIMTVERTPSGMAPHYLERLVARLLGDESAPVRIVSEEMFTHPSTGQLRRRRQWVRNSSNYNGISLPPESWQGRISNENTNLRSADSARQRVCPHLKCDGKTCTAAKRNGDTPVSDEDDKQACTLCSEHKRNTVLEPCGHELCATCKEETRLRSSENSKPMICPFCRKVVTGSYRIGLASQQQPPEI
ncbi:uncharacterized protein [Bemisia tabaci]|uniref:uncharacterized protein n=1 Tax=Bemisia tabaci TaxID=7038 RepID=UPI003B27D937